MFGLSLEKLIVFVAIAALVLGPQRLPQYAHRLGELVRSLRTLLDATRERTRAELGADLSADEWRRLDPRRYDPRAIIRDALATGGEDTRPVVAAVPVQATESTAPPLSEHPRPRYDSAGRVIRTP